MSTLLVSHRVTDYAGWRAVYDSAEVDGVRSAGGVISERVLRHADDPDNLVVEHVFADAAAAGAFLQNPALRDAMGRAGVVPESFSAMILEDA